MKSDLHPPIRAQQKIAAYGVLLATGAGIGLLYGLAIYNGLIGLALGLAAGAATCLAALRKREAGGDPTRVWRSIPVPAPLLGLLLATAGAWIFRLLF